METFFYFADREAIEWEFVKVTWLDVHGNCLCITKMAPNVLTGMRSMFCDGYTMEEAVLDHGIHDPDNNDGDDDDKKRDLPNKGKREADPDHSNKSRKRHQQECRLQGRIRWRP